MAVNLFIHSSWYTPFCTYDKLTSDYACKNLNSSLTELQLCLLSKSLLQLCSLRERDEVAPDKFWHIGHEAAKLASTFLGSVQFKFRLLLCMLSGTFPRGGC